MMPSIWTSRQIPLPSSAAVHSITPSKHPEFRTATSRFPIVDLQGTWSFHTWFRGSSCRCSGQALSCHQRHAPRLWPEVEVDVAMVSYSLCIGRGCPADAAGPLFECVSGLSRGKKFLSGGFLSVPWASNSMCCRFCASHYP